MLIYEEEYSGEHYDDLKEYLSKAIDISREGTQRVVIHTVHQKEIYELLRRIKER